MPSGYFRFVFGFEVAVYKKNANVFFHFGLVIYPSLEDRP